MVDEVVLPGGAHEGDQCRDISEGEQILVVAEERFPLLAVLTPARRPQRHHVTGGHRQLDRHNVSSHGAQRSRSPSLLVRA